MSRPLSSAGSRNQSELYEVNPISATLLHAWNILWPILIALIVFGILIVTHEGGHFAFAKLFKVRVNEFSVGMGPKLWGRKKKETQYTLRLFPIGGYVAMEGEHEGSEDPGSFESKPPWQKGLIILAGPLVNLLTGVLLVTILLGTSSLIATPVVKDFSPNAATYEQGLREGDKITAIDRHRIYTYYDMAYYLTSDPDHTVNLTVSRNGQSVLLEDFELPTAADEEGKTYISADFRVKGVKPTFASVSKYAWLDSVSMARMVWDSVGGLLSNRYGMDDLSGPIGTIGIMADTTSSAVSSANWQTLLMLWALLAINIGVFNLIPFPALDGGRFFFIILEGIRRKPVSERVQAAINQIGMSLLIFLMIYVTVGDIAKLF